MGRAATSFGKARVDTIKHCPKRKVHDSFWLSAQHFAGLGVRGYYAVVAIDQSNGNWNAVDVTLQ